MTIKHNFCVIAARSTAMQPPKIGKFGWETTYICTFGCFPQPSCNLARLCCICTYIIFHSFPLISLRRRHVTNGYPYHGWYCFILYAASWMIIILPEVPAAHMQLSSVCSWDSESVQPGRSPDVPHRGHPVDYKTLYMTKLLPKFAGMAEVITFIFCIQAAKMDCSLHDSTIVDLLHLLFH